MAASDETPRERPSGLDGYPGMRDPEARHNLLRRFVGRFRRAVSDGAWVDVPFTDYALITAFHPTWKGKDGDRWHIQIWNPNSKARFNCIISHRGWKPKVIR